MGLEQVLHLSGNYSPKKSSILQTLMFLLCAYANEYEEADKFQISPY